LINPVGVLIHGGIITHDLGIQKRKKEDNRVSIKFNTSFHQDIVPVRVNNVLPKIGEPACSWRCHQHILKSVECADFSVIPFYLSMLILRIDFVGSGIGTDSITMLSKTGIFISNH
jgi:hypothetical protein